MDIINIMYLINPKILGMYLGWVILIIMWSWIQSKIYKMIKEKHPQEYEKLGEPRFWKMLNPGATAILYGKMLAR